MTDTLERCARVLCWRQEQRGLLPDGATEENVWNSYHPNSQECFRDDVRAVIEALMEPDEAALEAGAIALLDFGAADGVTDLHVRVCLVGALKPILGGEG